MQTLSRCYGKGYLPEVPTGVREVPTGSTTGSTTGKAYGKSLREVPTGSAYGKCLREVPTGMPTGSAYGKQNLFKTILSNFNLYFNFNFTVL